MNATRHRSIRPDANSIWSGTWLVTGLGIAMMGCSGCTDPGPNRFPISGTVTLDGQPLDRATLILTPQGRGRAAAACIEAGKFELTSIDGPTQGTFHIRINPLDPMSGDRNEGPNASLQGTRQGSQLLPLRYQRDGLLQVTIAGQPHQHLDLRLSSRDAD
ncbi:MAG: hypothetical protein ACK5OB_07870 [Pirellula sp.]